MFKLKQKLIILLLCFWSLNSSAEQTITFGIVPQQSASKLAKLWVPILEKVSKETGYKLQFKTAPNIPEFEKRCADGQYDIAYMNPYHFTVFNRSPGYTALAKQKDKRIKGIVVVRKDSPLQDLTELNGQPMAFPAPAAFAASVLPRAYLRSQQIDITPSYVSSHDSVYRAVAKGLFPAGGGIQRTFNNMDPEIKDQLRVLWTSEGFTPHAFAAHPDLDPAVAAKITQALIDLENTEEGQALLQSIKFKGVEPASNEDWDDVRALGIDLLEQLIQG